MYPTSSLSHFVCPTPISHSLSIQLPVHSYIRPRVSHSLPISLHVSHSYIPLLVCPTDYGSLLYPTLCVSYLYSICPTPCVSHSMYVTLHVCPTPCVLLRVCPTPCVPPPLYPELARGRLRGQSYSGTATVEFA